MKQIVLRAIKWFHMTYNIVGAETTKNTRVKCINTHARHELMERIYLNSKIDPQNIRLKGKTVIQEIDGTAYQISACCEVNANGLGIRGIADHSRIGVFSISIRATYR